MKCTWKLPQRNIASGLYNEWRHLQGVYLTLKLPKFLKNLLFGEVLPMALKMYELLWALRMFWSTIKGTSVKISTDLLSVKNVRNRSYSGPHFPAFGLNTERYGLSLLIQSECGKMRTRITQNTDTFHECWTKFTKWRDKKCSKMAKKRTATLSSWVVMIMISSRFLFDFQNI